MGALELMTLELGILMPQLMINQITQQLPTVISMKVSEALIIRIDLEEDTTIIASYLINSS
jgi:hypothetical protein